MFTIKGIAKKKQENMDRCHDIFRVKGYQLKEYSKDNHSFYHCLNMSVLDNMQDVTRKKAMQTQKDLFEIEMKTPIYYHMFLPQCVECDGKLTPIDCLSAELKIIKKEKKPPTPREIFAAAEMLKRCICIIRFDYVAGGDIERLKGYMFAPTNEQLFDMEPICILMIEKYGGRTIFSRICRLDNTADLKPCPGNIVNLNHIQCFGLRFVNEFPVLFDCHVAFGERTEVKDLYRRLSLEFYGSEIYHDRILNIICNFELEEDNLELFCKYADNEITEETSIDAKKGILKTHVKEIKEQKKPGEGELVALSSVFNVDLIVEKKGGGEWETYMSAVCCHLSSFDSPIILSIEPENGDSMPYVTEPGTCSCRQQKPQIQGHIGKVKANIHDTVCMYIYVAKPTFI